jgi:hypothetical protein
VIWEMCSSFRMSCATEKGGKTSRDSVTLKWDGIEREPLSYFGRPVTPKQRLCCPLPTEKKKGKPKEQEVMGGG